MSKQIVSEAHPLLNVLTQLIPCISYPRTLNALRVLDKITLEKK